MKLDGLDGSPLKAQGSIASGLPLGSRPTGTVACHASRAMLPKVLGADELSFSLISSVFLALCRSSYVAHHTCGAPRVIAPWRGEREWFPVSNPASCWDVDVREDGRSRRLFRGPRRQYSAPWQTHGSPPCAHVGGRPPSRVHTGLAVSLLIGCFSALRPLPCMSR